MASLPNLGHLDADYSDDEMDNILGLLTPPVNFHRFESQQSIPSLNSSLPSTIASVSPRILSLSRFNNSSVSQLSAMPIYSPIATPPLPVAPSQIPSSFLTSQISDMEIPMTNLNKMIFTQTKKATQSQTVSVNLSPENDPILQQIQREFETASPVLTQDVDEHFEFDEDLEEEFSQVCSSDDFAIPSTSATTTSQKDEGGSSKKENTQEPTKKSLFPADVTLIPLSVSKVFHHITARYSDFAFVFAIAAQTCQDLLPMDCFIHLKIGLLLSLASIEVDGKRPPISIIAFGKDSSSANLLMTNIGNAARRFVSPTEDFNTGLFKDNFVKFGPLQLARTGVCYIGNWSRLKQQLSDKMFKSLETGKLLIEGTTTSMPLQCAVWGYWNAFKHNSKDQHVFNKFFEIFGVPIILEDRAEEDLIDFLLKQATVGTDELTVDELAIPLDELKMFLDVISRRTVDFTKESSDLLQKYFVASRADRQEALTPQAFSVIKQMSESFAKISCRHEVMVIDVIGAIFMAEDVLNHAFGPGAYPSPKYKTFSLIGEVDEFMNSFQKWLLRYIDKF
ncbi:mei-218 family protein [Megaselia abdita]